MRSWAIALIFASMCFMMLASVSHKVYRYRRLDNIVVLTGGDFGNNEHMFKPEGDDNVRHEFFGRICDQDGLRPGMVLDYIVYKVDYVRSCWDKSYPGGVKYRRDHEHKVIYVPVPTEQAQGQTQTPEPARRAARTGTLIYGLAHVDIP